MITEPRNRASERPENELGGISTRRKGGSAKCKGIAAFCKRYAEPGQTVILLANEGSDGSDRQNMVGLANSFQILQDNWILVPYGDQPIQHNGSTVLQRLTFDAANAMARRFHSWRGKATRKFAGLPFYIGHPDHPAFANEHTDTKAYGWIMSLEARPDGLAFQVNWSDAGHALLANAHYKFYSPNWEARIIGKEAGTPVAEPIWLKSVGFTNNPNWPVFPLANEQQTQGEKMNILQRLIAILGMAEGASEDDVVMAATKLVEAAKKIREAMDAKWDAEDAALNALPNEATLDERLAKLFEVLDGKIAGLANEQTELTTIKEQLTQETAKREQAELDFANERQTHAATLVEAAIRDGRVLPADKDKWISDLTSDFTGKAESLANALPVIKTKSTTGDLAPGADQETSRRGRILTLVNQKMTATGRGYHESWLAVKNEAPALFKQEAKAE